MLFKLSPYFAVNNIYSYTKSSKLTAILLFWLFIKINFVHWLIKLSVLFETAKEHILNRVVNRYGTAGPYIIVGKSDEQNISQKVRTFYKKPVKTLFTNRKLIILKYQLELPFWPVTEKEHFESLSSAMVYYFS